MKRQLLLIICICANLIANAQLEVTSAGRVSIQNTPINSYGLTVGGRNEYSIGTRPEVGGGLSILTRHGYSDYIYGISIRNALVEDTTTYGVNVQQFNNTNMNSIGVRSLTTRQISAAYNISVFGGITNNRKYCNSAAIFGSTTSTPSFDYPGIYAGYFVGDVRVTSNIFGNIYTPEASSSAMDCSTTIMLSDFEEGICERMQIMQPLQRTSHRSTSLDVPSELVIPTDATDAQIEALLNEHSEKAIDNTSSISYEIPTEQLEKTYPELVYKDENGNKSINYVGMIPLLVQSINELNDRVKELEGMQGISKRQNKVSTRPETVSIESTDTDETFVLSISQNNPNPFSEATSIKVTIPEIINEAKLCIYDMTGKPINHRLLAERGVFRVSVNSEGLTPGMYLYSLIADGKVVNTRKMIIE